MDQPVSRSKRKGIELKEVRETVIKIFQENPETSATEIARSRGINRNTVYTWKSKALHTEHVRPSTLISTTGEDTLFRSAVSAFTKQEEKIKFQQEQISKLSTEMSTLNRRITSLQSIIDEMEKSRRRQTENQVETMNMFIEKAKD